MKTIVVFGSTGTIGLCALAAAVKKGLTVRAFVRNPSKLPEDLKSKVEVVKGNVLEPDSVHEAVEGTDGVVIALGTGSKLDATTDLSEGIKNIIDAMRAHNVKNVTVCLSAFLFYDAEKVPPIFVEITKEHNRMYQALKESPLNYVAVFPPHFTEDPSRETIIQINPKTSPGRAISKWDLGTFLVDALSEPKYYKSVIGICNVPKE